MDFNIWWIKNNIASNGNLERQPSAPHFHFPNSHALPVYICRIFICQILRSKDNTLWYSSSRFVNLGLACRTMEIRRKINSQTYIESCSKTRRRTKNRHKHTQTDTKIDPYIQAQRSTHTRTQTDQHKTKNIKTQSKEPHKSCYQNEKWHNFRSFLCKEKWQFIYTDINETLFMIYQRQNYRRTLAILIAPLKKKYDIWRYAWNLSMRLKCIFHFSSFHFIRLLVLFINVIILIVVPVFIILIISFMYDLISWSYNSY